MSDFELIDNLDKIDYKFHEEIRNRKKYSEFELIDEKYIEIVNQIFRSPSKLFAEQYDDCYQLAFQEYNREILNHIIKKYKINKEFIDKFYEEILNSCEKFDAKNHYIYLFLRNSFGDLLINKYTMAFFTVLVEIVENILKTNLKWYNEIVNIDGMEFIESKVVDFKIIKNLNKLMTFDMYLGDNPTILTDVIDFIFIKHFNWNKYFRKYYVARRIEEVTDFVFKDQTQYEDCEENYNDDSQDTFYDFCDDICSPWFEYDEFVGLDEKTVERGFMATGYLDNYKSIEDFYGNPIYYECNIVKFKPFDDCSDYSGSDSDSDLDCSSDESDDESDNESDNESDDESDDESEKIKL